MKLASIVNGRDGRLVVVSDDNQRYVEVVDIAPTMQSLIDDWSGLAPQLQTVSDALNSDQSMGSSCAGVEFAAPLPRAYQWLDGSAYINHMELVRKARNAEMPESFYHDPLMYQGGSDTFLSAKQPITGMKQEWGIDLEAEIAVIVDDVPMGASIQQAAEAIRLVMLINDVSLRHLIPAELAKGFGFVQSKPSTAFAPFAVTPRSLGSQWSENKLHRPVDISVNGEFLGNPNAGVDMTFDFAQLIAHAAKSRALSAGTIVGSGTVSNVDRATGSACLAEVRMIEIIETGEPSTEFLGEGDRVVIDVIDERGVSMFGTIDQVVKTDN